MAEEDKPYVDPNSGLATQPGGYANAVGVPFDPETDEDPNPDPGGSSVLVDGVITDAAELGEVDPPENTTEPEDANDPGPEDEQVAQVEEIEGDPAAAYAEREHEAAGDLVGPGEPNPADDTPLEVVDGVVQEVETEENEVGADSTPSDTTEATDNGRTELVQEEAAPAVEEPSKGDSRAAWVEFARTKGAPEEELAEGGLKRNELAEKYGS